MTITLAQAVTVLHQQVNDRQRRQFAYDDEVENSVLRAYNVAWPHFYEEYIDSTPYTGASAIAANTISVNVPTGFLASGSRGVGEVWALRARIYDAAVLTGGPVYYPWFFYEKGVDPDLIKNISSPVIRFIPPVSQQVELEVWGGRPLTPPTRYDFTASATTDTFTCSTTDTFTNGTTVSLGTNDFDSLPTGVAASRRYYVVSASSNTFKLSLTSGGAAIDITVDGAGTLVITSTTLPGTDIPGFSEWLLAQSEAILRRTRSTSNAEDRQGQNTLALLADQRQEELRKRYKMIRKHETQFRV